MRNPQVDPRQQRALAWAAVLALLLSGCTHVQAHPAAAAGSPPAAAQTACVAAAQIPAAPPMVGARFNGDAKHDLQVLAPNAKALRDWGQAMHAMLEACAAKPTDAAATKPGG